MFEEKNRHHKLWRSRTKKKENKAKAEKEKMIIYGVSQKSDFSLDCLLKPLWCKTRSRQQERDDQEKFYKSFFWDTLYLGLLNLSIVIDE